MIVVADTTPLLYLARVRRLELVRELYAEVLIPFEVRRELIEKRPDAPGADALRRAAWLLAVEAPPILAEHEAVLADLDRGEAAALRLALVCGADLVLVDERAGRRAAHALKLAVRGTLGMLVEARHRRLLDAVAPVLDDLERSGFRVGPELRAWTLAAAGERE